MVWSPCVTADSLSDAEIAGQIKVGLRFYEANYYHQLWMLDGSQQHPRIGAVSPRWCRFCGGVEPKVTFRLEAHVIPECLGNRSLLSNQECDECNRSFGRGIDNDFGNWSNPMRTIGQIRGKKRRPSIKRPDDGGWRLKSEDGALHIEHHRDLGPMVVDEEAKRMTLRLPRDPYVPIAVLKAFVRMGLGLVPESDVSLFRRAFDWVLSPDHQRLDEMEHRVGMHLFPGQRITGSPSALLLLRKSNVAPIPYGFLILGYGNQSFQVMLPSKEKDAHWEGTSPDFPTFLVTSVEQVRRWGLPQFRMIDLSGTQRVTGDVEILTATYDAREQVG